MECLQSAAPTQCRPTERLKGYLARRGVVRFGELARASGVDRDVIESELKQLVCEGAVEYIRPVTTAGRGDTIEFTPTACFRLVRETDRAYLWEQEVVVRLPVTRMFKLREKEERRAPRRRSILNIAFGY